MPNDAPAATPAAALESAAPANGAPPPLADSSSGSEAASDGAAGTPEQPAVKARDHADFARRRHALSQQKKQQAERERQLAEREKQIAEQSASQSKELAELRAKLESWERGNPLERIASTGGDPAKAIQDYVEKSAPERQIEELQRKIADTEKRDAETRKLIEAKEKEFLDRETKQRDAALKAHEARERQGFVQRLRASAKEFPFVHEEYEDAEIDRAAAEIQEWARTVQWQDETGALHVGKQVTFEEAAKFLDTRAKARHDSKQQRRKALGLDDDVPGQQARAKPAPGSGRREDRPPPRTSAGATPRKLTPDEEREEDLRALRAASEKDRLANAKTLNGRAK